MKVIHVIALALLVVGTFSVAACETMEGFGQDVQKAGASIEKAAD